MVRKDINMQTIDGGDNIRGHFHVHFHHDESGVCQKSLWKQVSGSLLCSIFFKRTTHSINRT